MQERRRRSHLILTVVLLAMLPGLAYAQDGAISGVVRDETGGVLPGVTVEASSPALIERVRVGVTSDQGLYRILELPPGIYAVTFTLSGFSTHVREGIELTAGFTAPVNVEMGVGNVEETVTVTGQSPVVDVQNVRTQRVMTREVIDVIPTGSRSFDNLGALIPGMSVAAAFTSRQDVGTQRVMTREVIDVIPTGSRSFDNLGALIPGMSVAGLHLEAGRRRDDS